MTDTPTIDTTAGTPAARVTATDYEQAGYDKAVADFERVQCRLGGLGEYFHERACAHYQHGENAQVVTEISRVLRLDPTDAEARMIRAASLWALGEYERALDDFDQAVTVTNREHPFTLFRRATAYRHLATNGDDNEAHEATLVAIGDFERMLALVELGHGPAAPPETIEAARAALPELHALLNVDNDNDNDNVVVDGGGGSGAGDGGETS